MGTSDPTLERVVQAFIGQPGDRDEVELVRYDRAGKWFIEWPARGERKPVKIAQAAKIALVWEMAGGTIFPRQYGGNAFIREVGKLRHR